MRYILSLIAVFSFFTISARDIPDSLKVKMDAAAGDSERVHVLLDIALGLEATDHAGAIEFSKWGKAEAERLGYHRGVGISCLQLGRFHMYLGKEKEALEYLFEAVRTCEKYKMLNGLANAFAHISAVYHTSKKLDLALQYLQKALETNTRNNFRKGMVRDYFGLQQIMSEMKRYDKALEYGEKALALEPDEATRYTLYLNMGFTYKEIKQYDKALHYAGEAYNYYVRTGYSLNGEAEALRLKALVFIARKQYGQAEKFIQLATAKYREANVIVSLPDFYYEIARMYKEKNDYRNATLWLEKRQAAKDSLSSEENNRQVAEMETRYQTELKERQILEQRQAMAEQEIVLADERLVRNGIIALTMLLLAVAVAVYYNMRRVRKLNKELVELHAVKNKLFSIVSHDLRSPLSTLQNLLVLFKDANLSPEKMNRYTEKLQLTLQNTSQLLDNILHWAATQMHSIQPRAATVNVRSIAEESFDLIKLEAEQKRIILENKITPTALVLADENMLRVVFRNLLSNSIKFTPEGGHVSVMDDVVNGQVRISVKDTGVGMDEEIRKSLFEATKVQSRLGTAKEKGFGIGLQLCREYVERNGGQMDVESVAGEGSTFHFTLLKPANA